MVRHSGIREFGNSEFHPLSGSNSYLDHGILTWPHGYDIAPETLRRYAEAGSLD